MRIPKSALLGTAAMALELLAVFLSACSPSPTVLIAGLCFHLAACAGCLLATGHRGEVTPVERDIVALIAFFVPLFGPALAWTIPLGNRGREVRSSARMLEDLEQRLLHEEPARSPRYYRGDYEADLARELNTLSYHELLERGDLDQKRNALRKLARLGEAQHMATIKRFLADPEPELRLCAYLEIDRIRVAHERKVAELRKRVQEIRIGDHGAESAEQCLTELAAAHREYAASGVLERTMARIQLEQAVSVAEQALAGPRTSWRAALVQCLARCDLGLHDAARESLDLLPEAARNHPAIRTVRAQRCFRRRDFAGAREEAQALLSAGHTLPEWLQALSDAEEAREEPLRTEVQAGGSPP